MALIACPECGHQISSFARFCPKCRHAKSDAKTQQPPCADPAHSVTLAAAKGGEAVNDDRNKVASCDELLQHDFRQSPDEVVVREGQAFLVKGLLRVVDCYAYLTSKRYVMCDATGSRIVFQISNNDFASVADGRHLLAKKIAIKTVSGDTYQIKCQPHDAWLRALLDPQASLQEARKALKGPPTGDAGALDWYYEADGMDVGPIQEKSIIQLIQSNGIIHRHTRVWNKSLPEWKRAEETILTIYFSEPSGSGAELSRAAKGQRGLLSQVGSLFRKYL